MLYVYMFLCLYVNLKDKQNSKGGVAVQNFPQIRAN